MTEQTQKSTESEGSNVGTGLESLDKILGQLHPGENIVWQVSEVKNFIPFAEALQEKAKIQKENFVYFRFDKTHSPLLKKEETQVVRLHPEKSFESFMYDIFDAVDHYGPKTRYVFDCISELAANWTSDRMLGNFFNLATQYLGKKSILSYFVIRREYHSSHATTPIKSHSHILMDIFRNSEDTFIQLIKAQNRFTSRMHMLYHWTGEVFKPITSSVKISEIMEGIGQPWTDFISHRLGVWSQSFHQAFGVLHRQKRGLATEVEVDAYFQKILRMLIPSEEKLLEVARKYFDLKDLLQIRKRMIGTGQIGGKAFGMLLARAILKKTDPHWKVRLEAHDSFFIGTDVYYTYLVRNGCWFDRRRQSDMDAFLESSHMIRKKVLLGDFPSYIWEQFREMLEYFGQSPIIVRSSSMLEDGFGNAFSGKYESIFCANQGTIQQRLSAFISAVRTVYASSLSHEALLYRKKKGLLDQDEQMSILVQRVSGDYHGDRFFPQIAGVGYSYNPYAWHESIDPNAGLIRLVFGLGTRAVDRSDDDYTRVIALNAPEKQPVTGGAGNRRYTQRRVDVLDLKKVSLSSCDFEELTQDPKGLFLDIFASRDWELERTFRQQGVKTKVPLSLTFEKLLRETDFAQEMRKLLRILEENYTFHVDVEFTANFLDNGDYRINLVQCRSFQVQDKKSLDSEPLNMAPKETLFQNEGPIIGRSMHENISRVIYVVPSLYGQLPMAERYAVARLIGEITKIPLNEGQHSMIVGPGRWGTTSPELGVPVSFSEISPVSVIVEIVAMNKDIIPDISLGTHFFNDLVEMDMLYIGLHPENEGTSINFDFFEKSDNFIKKILTKTNALSEVVRVIEGANTLRLFADSVKQKSIFHITQP